MGIQDSIEAIEQQIFVACSEGDYDTVTMLEHQLQSLKRQYKDEHWQDASLKNGDMFSDDWY